MRKGLIDQGLDAIAAAGGAAAVSEAQGGPCRLSFNGSLRVDFQGARVTSGGGLLRGRDKAAGDLSPFKWRLLTPVTQWMRQAALSKSYAKWIIDTELQWLERQKIY